MTKASGASCNEGSLPVDKLATAVTSAVNKMSDTLVQIEALCSRAGYPSDSRAAPATTSTLPSADLLDLDAVPEPELAQPKAPAELQDLFKGELPEEPWQNRRYDPDNRLWQAAAMRKKAHVRRSNVSLGVCTVDLSGPHEPSPRPGNHIHRDPVSYCLVLSIRPDRTAEKIDMAVQTEDGEPAAPEPHSDK